jgi:hypothetical protein
MYHERTDQVRGSCCLPKQMLHGHTPAFGELRWCAINSGCRGRSAFIFAKAGQALARGSNQGSSIPTTWNRNRSGKNYPAAVNSPRQRRACRLSRANSPAGHSSIRTCECASTRGHSCNSCVRRYLSGVDRCAAWPVHDRGGVRFLGRRDHKSKQGEGQKWASNHAL